MVFLRFFHFCSIDYNFFLSTPILSPLHHTALNRSPDRTAAPCSFPASADRYSGGTAPSRFHTKAASFPQAHFLLKLLSAALPAALYKSTKPLVYLRHSGPFWPVPTAPCRKHPFPLPKPLSSFDWSEKENRISLPLSHTL